MQADSLQIRRVAIAYVFPAMPQLEHRDTLAFYDKVKSARVDFTEFTQQPAELVLLKRSTTGSDHITEARVGQIGPNAYRCLYAEAGGLRALTLVEESADIVFDSFLEVWGARIPPCQLVEASFQCAVATKTGGGATGFLWNQLDTLGQCVADHLGRKYQGVGVKMVSGPLLQVGDKPPSNMLRDASAELTLEALDPESRELVFSLVAKWPRIQIPTSGLPPEARKALGGKDLLDVNAEMKPPKQYIQEVHKYLTDRVMPFVAALADGE